MKTIRTPFALLAASALLLLAGCSGGGTAAEQEDTAASSAASAPAQESAAPAADQSKADACQIVIASFSDVTQASSSMSSTDPEAAMATFRDLAAKVQSDFAGITNSEIAPFAQDASATLNDYVAFIEGLTVDPSNASALTEQVTALQDSFTAAGTACTG